jgi:diguanylate cyclase (GGDEF)-like protein/PAS domain S-box-containing protein
MNKEMRILIVEDSAVDAELNEREIKQTIPYCTFQRVETEADFLRALDEFKPDIIISDYTMPSFDGMTALKLTLEKTPMTPFIVVTGSMNEDTAVDCLKAGATNYVIKQHLKRLGSAILHGLEEKQMRMEKLAIQEELKKSEARYSTIVNSSPNVIFVHKAGLVFYVNDTVSRLLGYSRDEIVGKSLFEFVADDSKEIVSRNMQRRMASEEVEIYEAKVIAKTGDIKYFFVASSVIPYEEGSAFLVILSDITERKKAEDEVIKTRQDWKNIFHAIGHPTIILDPQHTILSVNQAVLRALGADSEEELIGKKCYEIFHNASTPPQDCPLVKLCASGELTSTEMEVEALGGTYLVSCTPVFDEKGDLQKVIHIATDITEESLRESEMKMHDALFAQTAINMLLSESLDNISLEEFLPRALAMVLSVPWLAFEARGSMHFVEQDPEMLVMKAQYNLPEPLRILCEKVPFGKCLCGKAALTQKIEFVSHIDERHEICYSGMDSHGHYIVPIISGSTTIGVINIYLKEGHIRNDTEEEFLSAISNTLSGIIMRKKAEEKIEYLAYYDALTALPNRNLFIDRLTQGLARAEYSKKLVAVLSIDIDRFKSINDTYGLDTGDAVLREMAKRLLSSVRDGDSVARLGNDDFGILLIDIAEHADIILVVEKIMKNASLPIYFQGKEIVLTLSVGISVYPDDGSDAFSLIKNANLAFAKAKHQGRKSYQFYTEGLDLKASEFVLMEKNLFNAIQNEEFILHYQPYWDINMKEIAGLEALIRWRSPEVGLVSPGKFIPVLEETRMIVEVGEWILRTALGQMKEWQNKGYQAIAISVNLSLVQFRQKNLSEMIEEILGKSGFPPSLLSLEITESAFVQDIENTRLVLGSLKDIGVSISIDDFGTGYSSLAHLKRFPIDNLKIDMSFIRDIADDPDTASIVTAIIAMARTLNLKTIAEGIETEEQWKTLRLLRCDMGQGYYFSKPLPAEEVEKFFKQQ